MKAWLLHDPPQHVPELAAAGGPRPGDGDSEVVERAAPMWPASVETPEQMLMRDSLDADLQEALDLMPDAFREAVWLRDVEEFSYAEIAAMLDSPDRHGDVAHLAGAETPARAPDVEGHGPLCGAAAGRFAGMNRAPIERRPNKR